MTEEQILELAKTCGIRKREDENLYKCWGEQLLKFARAIHNQTIDEILTSLKEVPNPQANQTAINRILNQYETL